MRIQSSRFLPVSVFRYARDSVDMKQCGGLVWDYVVLLELWRVDLVEAETRRAKCEGSEGRSSTDSESVVTKFALPVVECVWTHIHGFDPTLRYKGVKDNRVIFIIRE